MALPFPDDAFDVAVMALVIFFVPEPARGVAEWRVVCPAGLVSAYSWDMLGRVSLLPGALQVELRGMGVAVLMPPSPNASRMDCGGLVDGCRSGEPNQTRGRSPWSGPSPISTITGRRSSVGRASVTSSPRWRPGISALLKARMRVRLPEDATGRITYECRANAIKGRVPRPLRAPSWPGSAGTRRSGIAKMAQGVAVFVTSAQDNPSPT